MKALACLLLSATWIYPQDQASRSAIDEIRAEAYRKSQVMEYAFYLTDVHGPRLTGSPAFAKAGEWTMNALKSAGLDNVRAEPLDNLGKSWSYRRFSVHQVEPQTATLTGMPYPWSRSTRGRQTGAAIAAPLPPLSNGPAIEAFIARYKGKLRNTILLVDRPRNIQLETTTPPLFRRYSDSDLKQLAGAKSPTPPQQRSNQQGEPTPKELAERLDRVLGFLQQEGVIAVATLASGNGGTIHLDGTFGDRMKSHTLGPPAMQLAPESYNRIARLVEKDIPVQVEVEIDSSFHDGNHFSVVGELTGGAKKDEVVLLGAHLDSWHGATGATDNAAGVAVVMEAMRILSTTRLPMHRTVRAVFWGGHEIGGQGSQQYIRKHYAEAAGLCCYFNLDFGAGRIRGLHTQGDERWAPMFQAWLAPFQDLGATTVSNQTAGGSDHIYFQQAGLPGFPFMQDPLAYWTRTHHTNVDAFDYLIEEDLRQSATILAAVAYQAAMFDRPLPFKNPRER